jgi:hypothetical protein
MRPLVKASVKRAFKTLGPLATSAVFKQKGSGAFDFSGNTAPPLAVETPLKVVELATKRKQGKDAHAVAVKSLLVIDDDVPNLDTYDSLVIDGVEWAIVHPIDSNGYTVTLDATRSL